MQHRFFYIERSGSTFDKGRICDPQGRIPPPVEIVPAQVAHTCAIGTHFGHLHGVIYAYTVAGGQYYKSVLLLLLTTLCILVYENSQN